MRIPQFNHTFITHTDTSSLLALVVPSHHHIHEEINHVDQRQHPIKVIELALVQIIPQPPFLRSSGHTLNDLDERSAEPAPYSDLAQEDCAADAPRPIRRLIVEELELAHIGEHLSTANKEELREEPEEAHAQRGRRALAPPPLDQSSRGHCKDREEEADPHPLERCDAAVVASAPAQGRHNQLLIERDKEEGIDGGKDGDRTGGDLEAVAKLAIHDGCLADEEGGELGEGDGERNGGCPHREDPQEGLEFLDLRHGAEMPAVGGWDGFSISYYCGFIPESATTPFLLVSLVIWSSRIHYFVGRNFLHFIVRK